ncbi:MAG: ATP-dependent Clp protease adaptor ClpS, partial [Gammaproteobacteria bacterium]|nr:ATP-dependent Clp protease adaptor ClpS [Gammaproteobacteria bacterium]
MNKDWITTGSQDPEDDREIGVIVAPDKPKLAKPPLWKVTLLNDD